MKKITTIALAAILTLSLASCKRDYTCTCTLSGTGTGVTEISINGTKKNAEDACSAQEISAGGATNTCELSKK